MATKNLTAADFNQSITANDIVLIDFWAEWCGPCRAFGPVYEAASQEHPDIFFGKVDTEAERDIAAALQIMSIPTLMAFRDGILLYAQPGALSAPQLAELIGAVREADMDQIRAELAEQIAADQAAAEAEPGADPQAVPATASDES